MNDLIILLIAFVIHELTHIIHLAIIIKRLPKVRFDGFAFEVGLENDWKEVTVREKVINHLLGVAIGFVPILTLSDSSLLALVYMLMSSADLFMAYAIMLNVKKWKGWNTMIGELECPYYQKCVCVK